MNSSLFITILHPDLNLQHVQILDQLTLLSFFLSQSSYTEVKGSVLIYTSCVWAELRPWIQRTRKQPFTGRSCLDFAYQCPGTEDFKERFSVLYGDKIFVWSAAWSSQLSDYHQSLLPTQLSEEISLRLCCNWVWTTTDRFWVNSACLCGQAAPESEVSSCIYTMQVLGNRSSLSMVPKVEPICLPRFMCLCVHPSTQRFEPTGCSSFTASDPAAAASYGLCPASVASFNHC